MTYDDRSTQIRQAMVRLAIAKYTRLLAGDVSNA